MAWNDSTGVADVIREPQPHGAKVYYINIEIRRTGGVREFTETDFDNRTTAVVVEGTGVAPILGGKGADGNRVFGYLEGISEDGATGDVLGAGVTDRVSYVATAPAVGDRVVSGGGGETKQATDLASTGAGGQLIGDGYVTELDTTATEVRLRWPL
jgi:hypothetical protein